MIDDMFLEIGNENIGRALAGSTVCRRCGAFIIRLDEIDTRTIHAGHHDRNDHAGPIPGSGDPWT